MNAFIEGVGQGIYTVVTDIGENLLQLAISIGIKIFGGVITAILKAVNIAITLVRIIGAIVEQGPNINYLFEKGTEQDKARFSGVIVGSVIAGIGTSLVLEKIGGAAINAIAKVGLIGKSMKRIADAGVDVTSDLGKALRKIMKEGDEGIEQASRIINMVEGDVSVVGKIKGRMTRLAGEELEDAVKWVKNTGDVFDVEEFLSWKAQGIVNSVDEYGSVVSWVSRYAAKASDIPAIKARVVGHIQNGDFDADGLYRFKGLHDVDRFMDVKNSGRIHPDYEIKSIDYKPDGITKVKWVKKSDPFGEVRIKSLAPRGTTTEDFIEAGFILKRDFEMGNFAEMTDKASKYYDESLTQFIFSKTTYTINGKKYHIQGYRDITNPARSSWWFAEEIPKGFN